MLFWQLVVNGILAAGCTALVAVGFGLIYRTARFFNFSHGPIVAAGPYFSIYAFNTFHVPYAIAAVVGVTAATLLGVALWTLIYAPLRQRGSSALTLLLVSVAVMTILQNALSILFGDAPIALLNGDRAADAFNILGATATALSLLTATLGFACSGLVAVGLAKTKWGNTILAVGADRRLAEGDGIDTEKITLAVVALSSALAAFAGILIGLDSNLTPTMSYSIMLTVVAAVVLGGVNSPLGWIGGAIVLGLAQHVGVYNLASSWQEAISFVILLTVIALRPNGLIANEKERA